MESDIKKNLPERTTKVLNDPNLYTFRFSPHLWTILHAAAWYGNYELSDKLLHDEKFDVNYKDEVS